MSCQAFSNLSLAAKPSSVFPLPLATQGSERKYYIKVGNLKTAFRFINITWHFFFPPFQRRSQRYIHKCLPCTGKLSHHLEMANQSSQQEYVHTSTNKHAQQINAIIIIRHGGAYLRFRTSLFF